MSIKIGNEILKYLSLKKHHLFIIFKKLMSAVAHMVAHWPTDPRVVGSDLTVGNDFSPNFLSVKCHKMPQKLK